MKSYTDLQQSKKLADILPLESADNYYSWHDERYYVVNKDCSYPYSLKEGFFTNKWVDIKGFSDKKKAEELLKMLKGE